MRKILFLTFLSLLVCSLARKSDFDDALQIYGDYTEKLCLKEAKKMPSGTFDYSAWCDTLQAVIEQTFSYQGTKLVRLFDVDKKTIAELISEPDMKRGLKADIKNMTEWMFETNKSEWKEDDIVLMKELAERWEGKFNLWFFPLLNNFKDSMKAQRPVDGKLDTKDEKKTKKNGQKGSKGKKEKKLKDKQRIEASESTVQQEHQTPEPVVKDEL
eukprot:Colp12_sorted_trinity150504_noHs@14164